MMKLNEYKKYEKKMRRMMMAVKEHGDEDDK